MRNPIRSSLDAALPEAVSSQLWVGEEPLIQIASDLIREGAAGRHLVVVTRHRVLVHRDDYSLTIVPLDDVISVRTETLVGGGCLEIGRREAPPIRIPCSASMLGTFSSVARGIDRLRHGEPLPLEPDRVQLRCERCGRLLPEKNDICPACIRRRVVFGRVAAYLSPYKGLILVHFAITVMITVAGLLPPAIMGRIIDRVLAPQDATQHDVSDRLRWLIVYVLALVGLRVLGWGLEWSNARIVAWLAAQVTADIRSQLYRRLEMLALRFYDNRDVAAVTSRITSDASTLQDFLIRGLPNLLINGLTVIGILAVMLSISVPLTLAVLLPVPIVWVWALLFWGRMTALFHRWSQAGARFASQLSESLSGIREVKAFGQQGREIARFAAHNASVFERTVDTARNRVVLVATMGIVTGTGVLAFWLIGGLKVVHGTLTLGALVAFYNYVLLFYNPLQWFGQFSDWMTRAFTGAQRIFDILDTSPEDYGNPESASMPRIRGHISFRDATFGYDKSQPVVHGLTFEVLPGQMLGIVGKSGAGKTTTVHLLCRFYDVDRGCVEIDGIDIRKIQLEDVRRHIGIVLQEPILFSGTIADNISYGKPGSSLAEIIEAAKIANAHPFILTKPEGYDTEVGEGGKRLSVGERQRVAIARAVLHNPRILILDEATSSVDALSEKAIHEALRSLAKGRTTFVIAHRVSTLAHADRLIVLDRGRIRETGTYDELIAGRGILHRLVQLQEEPPRAAAARA